MQEQRFQQFLDKTIVKHPCKFHNHKIMTEYNLKNTPPVTLLQVGYKMVAINRYREKDSEKWCNEIQEMADQHKKQKIVSPVFQKHP